MKILLYLRKKNHRDIIGLAILEGNIESARKIELDELKLSAPLFEKIKSVYEQNKLYYDLWISPFINSPEFVSALRKQGMKHVPMKFTPKFNRLNCPEVKNFKIHL